MATTVVTVPQFWKGQSVSFMGGVGIIKSYQPEADSWAYLVEMAMGPEPEMGRIGYETTNLLSQTELSLRHHHSYSDLAMSA